MSVRPLGSFLPLDAHGYVVNDSSMASFPGAWSSLLDGALRWYKQQLGDDLHSVWVRGSCVRGGIVEGVSDLDTLAIARRPPHRAGGLWVQIPGAQEHVKHLLSLTPSCPDLELDTASLQVALHEERGRFLRFLLATQAVCVWGETPTFEHYRVDGSLRFLLPELGTILQGVHDELRQPVQDVPALARWLGKIVVRAGLEFVIEREHNYARDLWPCYQAFARHEPERAPAMYSALELAVHAPDDLQAVHAVLDGIGGWLVQAASD